MMNVELKTRNCVKKTTNVVILNDAFCSLVKLGGWWAQKINSRFTFPVLDHFDPIPGAAGWQASNPPPLLLAVTQNYEFCVQNEKRCSKNEEFCIENDEFCSRSWPRWRCGPRLGLPQSVSELHSKAAIFVFKMMKLVLKMSNF